MELKERYFEIKFTDEEINKLVEVLRDRVRNEKNVLEENKNNQDIVIKQNKMLDELRPLRDSLGSLVGITFCGD